MSPQAIFLDEKSEQRTPLLPLDQPQAVPGEEHPRHDQTSTCARRRKWRTLAHIVFLWIGFFALSHYVRGWFRDGNEVHTMQSFQQIQDLLPSVVEWPIPPDVTVEDCTDWTGSKMSYSPRRTHFTSNGYLNSFAEFSLPISSEKLFVISRGMAAGLIKVQYDNDGDSGNKDVKIGVAARYRFQETIENVKVCTVNKGEGKNGLGIFGPQWSRHDVAHFEVIITLPKARKSSVLNVEDFETDAPLFAHEIEDLEGAVHFNSFKLKAANSPMRIQSLDAVDASIATINSPIIGKFHASSSLKLLTANAKIDVTVQLFNDDHKPPTDLLIKTSNAGVKANLELESAKSTGGKFKVVASTANAAIDLDVTDAPVDSVLQLDARTSLGPAHVKLHPTYEGTFSAASSLQRLNVIVDRNAKDPAGKGRERKVDLTVNGPTAAGSVWWSDGKDKKEPLGTVRVSTSWAPLTLLL